jgi:hypothetical protein
LPYQDKPRKVVLNPKPCDPVQCQAPNVVVNWQKRNCAVVRDNIGCPVVENVNPSEYKQAHGANLLPSSQLPYIANALPVLHGQHLAANDNTQVNKRIHIKIKLIILA